MIFIILLALFFLFFLSVGLYGYLRWAYYEITEKSSTYDPSELEVIGMLFTIVFISVTLYTIANSDMITQPPL
jgi:hypothetical protein